MMMMMTDKKEVEEEEEEEVREVDGREAHKFVFYADDVRTVVAKEIDTESAAESRAKK